MFPHLITRTRFDEEYRSLSFSLCSCLHSLAKSSLLDPNHTYNAISITDYMSNFFINSEKTEYPFTLVTCY
jgi:hypothetical protein